MKTWLSIVTIIGFLSVLLANAISATTPVPSALSGTNKQFDQLTLLSPTAQGTVYHNITLLDPTSSGVIH